MRVCHGVAARFGDPNLVSGAGLVPILQLAERAGFEQLVAEQVSIFKPGGLNAELKVSALVAGMVAGADSIDDMALLRHGGMGRLFGGVRAPLDAGDVPADVHVRPCPSTRRGRLPAADQPAPTHPAAARGRELTYIDVADTVAQTCGYAKQGAGRGYTGIKGLNSLLAIVSTPSSAPVIAAARLRKGSTNSVKGAADWSPTR